MRAAARVAALAAAALVLASCAAPARPPAPPLQAESARPVLPLAGRGPDPERWTGLTLEAVTEALARTANLPRVEGLYVRAIEAGSPAVRAGIRAGDVLLLAGGTYLASPDVLPRVLGSAPLGSTLEVLLRRVGDLLTVSLAAETSPPGRLMALIQPPGPGLTDLAADGAVLWAYGPVPGGADRGIVPIQVPGGPLPTVAARPVASPGAERVIAADGERIYLGWTASELYVDVYELGSGRVGRLPVRGAESLANRCRARGLTRVGPELWMACQRPEGPAVARIDLATGQARVEPLPPSYWAGLAFDGEAVLWLCCPAEGWVSLARTDLVSGVTRVIPLRERITSVAADPRAVYLLGAAWIYQHKPWR